MRQEGLRQYSPSDGYLGCFYLENIVRETEDVCREGCVRRVLNYLESMCGNTMADSTVDTRSILKKFPDRFQGSYAIFHSQQPYEQ